MIILTLVIFYFLNSLPLHLFLWIKHQTPTKFSFINPAQSKRKHSNPMSINRIIPENLRPAKRAGSLARYHNPFHPAPLAHLYHERSGEPPVAPDKFSKSQDLPGRQSTEISEFNVADLTSCPHPRWAPLSFSQFQSQSQSRSQSQSQSLPPVLLIHFGSILMSNELSTKISGA